MQLAEAGWHKVAPAEQRNGSPPHGTPQEGNPVADLPNYRAHCIATLGPSLALLDNRAVTPEERAAAAGAVAHEATMLALMVGGVQVLRLLRGF